MLRQISTVALTAALLLSPVLAAEETEFGTWRPGAGMKRAWESAWRKG